MTIQAPPVFITGCGHSGTSLLLAILGSHSKIYPVPQESKIGFKPLKRKLYLWSFDRRAIAQGKTRWIEKTPKHIFCIEQLLSIRPGTKVIIIIRDGRDVACSYKDRFGDLERGIKTWVLDNLAGIKYWNHPAVLVIKYEDLIGDVEATLRKILMFLGEDFEPVLLEYHRQSKYFYSDKLDKPASVSGKDHDQYRNWQINQPLFDGRGRWISLTAEEKNIIKKSGNDLLLELGYISGQDW